jgi:hypothetical protein
MTELTTKQKTMIGVGAALITAVLALTLWFLITHPVVTGAITDISIIILALVVLVMNVFLIVMMWQIIRLIDFLLFELKPVLESLQETTSTVRGTASFVSEEVSSPVIDAKAKAAGLKGSLRFVVDSLRSSAERTGRGPQGAASAGDAAQTPPPASGAAGNGSSGPAAGASDQPTA